MRNMREPVSITTDIIKNDFKTKLKDISITNLNRIIISHININSIRNKFELLAEVVMGNVDILMVTETNQLVQRIFCNKPTCYTWFHFTISF